MRSKNPRFTVDGSDELERHLAHTCAWIAAGVRGLLPGSRLEGLLLGGGYGRGEGGVLRTSSGHHPYNDLEFYVLVRGNRHLNELRFGRPLHVLGEILTPQAGAEVEFKLTSRRELERGPISMFSYDLVMGHRWLGGDDSLLARCGHHREAGRIPLAEATRLLMNRCSGLLFARERLNRPEFTTADADFVRRNIAKAELALGDALLVARGNYHWSVHERHGRVQRTADDDTLPWLGAVRAHHASGVEFKLHPLRATESREALLARHARVAGLAESVFLWIESQRLGVTFTCSRHYALDAKDKCPDARAARNLLVNLKAFGACSLSPPEGFRHPRGRVLRALALMLWAPDALTSPALLATLQRELRTQAADSAGMMRSYRERWAKVS